MKNRDYLLSVSDTELANIIIELRSMNHSQIVSWLSRDTSLTVRAFFFQHQEDNLYTFKFRGYEFKNEKEFLEKYGKVSEHFLDDCHVINYTQEGDLFYLYVR